MPRFTPATGVPPPDTPVVFADGVTNLAYNKYIVKFYLYRTDLDVNAASIFENRVISQMVMPIESFVATIAFLNNSIATLVAAQIISQVEVDR